MGKRLRKARSICCCASPGPSYRNPHAIFSWYEEDVWTEVAKLLDGRSLVMLAVTCKWFHCIMMEDSLWRYACLRDLQVPDPGNVPFKWIKLYAAAFDGSHTYMFRQQEKHIDWMRIGGFLFDSHDALLTENLIENIKVLKKETAEKLLPQEGYYLLNNIKTGIWIADLQLVRCLACDLDTCDGTMQTLDARHIELFLSEEYRSGSWDYYLLGSHNINKQADGASGGIFDIKHINDESTSEVFDLKSWVGKRNDWQPKTMITIHAVAVNTNLQDNEGLQIKYHAMKAGKDGEVVSIRISQIGEEYGPWVPFIGTMFLFIFVSNWSGALLPWKIIELPHGELAAPTNDINTTVALALLTSVAYFYAGTNKRESRELRITSSIEKLKVLSEVRTNTETPFFHSATGLSLFKGTQDLKPQEKQLIQIGN